MYFLGAYVKFVFCCRKPQSYRLWRQQNIPKNMMSVQVFIVDRKLFKNQEKKFYDFLTGCNSVEVYNSKFVRSKIADDLCKTYKARLGKIHGCLYLCFVVYYILAELFLLYIVPYSLENQETSSVTQYLRYSLIVYECLFIVLAVMFELIQLSRKGLDYFTSFWNSWQVAGYLLNFAVILLYLRQPYDRAYTRYYATLMTLASLGTFNNIGSLFYFMKAIPNFSFYLKFVANSFMQVRALLFILFVCLIMIGSPLVVMQGYLGPRLENPLYGDFEAGGDVGNMLAQMYLRVNGASNYLSSILAMSSAEDDYAWVLQQIALWLFYFTLLVINIGLLKIVIAILTATFNGMKDSKEAIQIQQIVDIWTDFGDIAELIFTKVLRQRHVASDEGDYLYFAQSFRDVPSDVKQGFTSVEQRL